MLYDAPTWQNALFPSGWGAYGRSAKARTLSYLVGATSSAGVSADGARIVVTTVVECS